MKNKFKFITVIFIALILLSSFCYAEDQTPIEPRTSDVEQINITDEAVTTNLENEAVTTDVEEAEPDPEEAEIYRGDLYIFEDTVNMDKLVDGNVYIIGKDVTITGQIAGNLFVIADNLTLGDDTSNSTYNGYVFYNVYALAKNATLKSSCYDLYLAANDVTLASSFYLYRDLVLGAKNANIFATIGRNAHIQAKNLNLKEGDSSYASIYGNLDYSSKNQLDEETLKTSVAKSTTLLENTTNLLTLSNIKIVAFFLLIIPVVILLLILTLIFRLILFIIRKFKKDKSNDATIKVEIPKEKLEDEDKK